MSDPDLPIETLSGGNQQKAVIARWLATKPKVLILDSPTVGIDVGAKRSVHQLIHDLAVAGVGIILITDEIDEALNNCTRVLLMRNGRIIADLDSSQEDEISVQSRLESALRTYAFRIRRSTEMRKLLQRTEFFLLLFIVLIGLLFTML